LFLLSLGGGLVISLLFSARLGILVFLAGTLTIFFKVSEFSASLLNIIRERKFNAIIGAIERYSFIVAILVLMYLKILTLEKVLIAYIILSIIFGLFKFRKFSPSSSTVASNPTFEKEVKKKIYLYVWPFIVWGISSWLQLNGEKWVIANYLSAADLGVYAVMLNIINAMISFPTYFITDFFTPHIFKNFSGSEAKSTVRAGYNYILINLGIVIVLILAAFLLSLLFGELFVKTISSDIYLESVELLPYLTIGTGFFYIGHVLTNVGLALGKTKAYIIPKVGAGILSLILNIVLIRYYGLAGITIAINITGFIYVSYLLVINKKLLGEIEK